MSTRVTTLYMCRLCGKVFEIGATLSVSPSYILRSSSSAHFPKELPSSAIHACDTNTRGLGELVGVKVLDIEVT